MLELLEGLMDIAGHGYVDVAVVIIPFDGKAAGMGARFGDGDGVMLSEGVEQVVEVRFGEKFNAEVFHGKCKRCWLCCVAP